MFFKKGKYGLRITVLHGMRGGEGEGGFPCFIRKRFLLGSIHFFVDCMSAIFDFTFDWNSRREPAERWEALEAWTLARDERVRLSPVSLSISSIVPDFSFKHRARNGLNSNFLVALVTFYNN